MTSGLRTNSDGLSCRPKHPVGGAFLDRLENEGLMARTAPIHEHFPQHHAAAPEI